jgi:serine/tyrosine/threonine adenylyltransferase
MTVNSISSPDFKNSYARLPERFFAIQTPEPAANPELIRANTRLAEFLGVNVGWLESAEGIAALAGNITPDGAEPIAAAYAGHQFGNWNPQLGDGRAVLLGEVIAEDGVRYDIQLKGSGRTPWSRGGDGRSPLGPVLREYIVSEAMHVLGVPTSRSLAALGTGNEVFRETSQPGAVLARVAKSHIRIGTFQYFAAREDTEAVSLLVDHCLQRHYPHRTDEPIAALALLEEVVQAQANLIAHWQLLGFIHGVMNTDNVLISGETIDYGPCAFMDIFDPDTVFSSIDHAGRYAYRNQPSIGHWNLSCLAQCLLPLLSDDQEQAVEMAQSTIDRYPELFLDAHRIGMNAKLGWSKTEPGDEELVQDLLTVLTEQKMDFTLSFRHLSDCADNGNSEKITDLLIIGPAFLNWIERWHARCRLDTATAAERQQTMYRANPVFIPRNHLVEAAIQGALEDASFERFNELMEVLQEPFRYQPDLQRYAIPPLPEEKVQQTFCGT